MLLPLLVLQNKNKSPCVGLASDQTSQIQTQGDNAYNKSTTQSAHCQPSSSRKRSERGNANNIESLLIQTVSV